MATLTITPYNTLLTGRKQGNLSTQSENRHLLLGMHHLSTHHTMKIALPNETLTRFLLFITYFRLPYKERRYYASKDTNRATNLSLRGTQPIEIKWMRQLEDIILSSFGFTQRPPQRETYRQLKL
jgi:hypothetical protein